ncbi:hypothetical protein LguiB_025125 [Lonicera macranthoides]
MEGPNCSEKLLWRHDCKVSNFVVKIANTPKLRDESAGSTTYNSPKHNLVDIQYSADSCKFRPKIASQTS